MYVNAYTQTDNMDFGKNSEGWEGPKNFEENKNMGKKQDCLWNVSRIKNYIKDKNSSYRCNTSKSNSLNDIIKKYKPDYHIKDLLPFEFLKYHNFIPSQKK